MLFTRPKTGFNFSAEFILSSANALNLEKSTILSFGKELKYSDPEHRFFESCFLGYFLCTKGNHSISDPMGRHFSMEFEIVRARVVSLNNGHVQLESKVENESRKWRNARGRFNIINNNYVLK